MRYKTLAIPVRRIDFSDSSQILTFFTQDFGAVECIAKGAYRPKNPFEGPFDLATLSEVVIHRQAKRSKLAIVVEASLLDGFRGLRKRWDRHVAAAHVVDFLRAVETPDQPNPELFQLACQSFFAIERSLQESELSALIVVFELQAFRALGLTIDIHSCVECGKPWRQFQQPVYFCPELVGVLCSRCRLSAARRSGSMVPGNWILALNQLGKWSGEAFRSCAQEFQSLESEQRSGLVRLIRQLRICLLERPFPMVEYAGGFL